MTKLAAILDQIDSGSALLPEFQRGYVWSSGQGPGAHAVPVPRVPGRRPAYLGNPGRWRAGPRRGRGGPGPRVLILDGQQRITSLYGITRGRPPAFFRGMRRHSPACGSTWRTRHSSSTRPQDARRPAVDRRHVAVQPRPRTAPGGTHADPRTQPRIVSHVQRLARLRQVLERDFHEEKITGEDKSIDVVVDIFNLVNSGGTKLSKGDLALAKKCAHWPEARATMRTYLGQWEKEGFCSP